MSEKEDYQFIPNLERPGVRVFTTVGNSIECFVGTQEDVCFFFKRKDQERTPVALSNEAAMAVFAILYNLHKEGYFDKAEDALFSVAGGLKPIGEEKA